MPVTKEQIAELLGTDDVPTWLQTLIVYINQLEKEVLFFKEKADYFSKSAEELIESHAENRRLERELIRLLQEANGVLLYRINELEEKISCGEKTNV